ncbi:MAG: hypothetical protein CVU13_02840 [Bacteroidetes bacterium HGW-Bacteroidetes-8]|jgi:hypothetical protein|nr:MAG: hypothetical protein CVU13_02840 [Bacteroidetes bacterium HGW-Bacteroidetes-8]
MPFIEEILNYGTLSIAGLEKNTGKTESLNYILNRLTINSIRVGVTSTGVDGERIDQVTRTSKPEIFLKEGVVFTTSEKHYRERKILSELLDISDETTSLGRLVTAKALSGGKVMLSGPVSTASLKRWIISLKKRYNVDLCIIDGALSRLSLASPAVSEAMILATGASLSLSIREIVNKTAYAAELIGLPLSQITGRETLLDYEQGIWTIGRDGEVCGPIFESAFTMEKRSIFRIEDGGAIYLTGALTERFLKMISTDTNLTEKELIIKDFTRIFVTPALLRNYLKKGGKITVLQKTKLIALTVNPISPNGYTLDSNRLIDELYGRVNIPVYDIKKNGYKI